MKIAIVGTGISGNVIAHYLNKKHDISVFESASYIGGHTHTHDVSLSGREYRIDTGFIVFNKQTYPNFINLLHELKVPYQKSDMSFSVSNKETGFEYNGSSLNQMFSQRSNLFKPKFYRMIKQIIRFNNESIELLTNTKDSTSLGKYLHQNGYSHEFIHYYIIPMGAAIWSREHHSMLEFPARFFVRFFHNHGMLSVSQRPQWYVIKNGSSSYISALVKDHLKKIRLNTQVESISRSAQKVLIRANGQEESFDRVFIATHSDQALALLENPSTLESQTLSLIPYTQNEAVLHYDENILPKRKLAWAAWNYHLSKTQKQGVALTYNMNILQSIQSEHTFCVTLNHTHAINDKKIIKKLNYAHPHFTVEGVKAQQKQSYLNGQNNTYYAGAYWGNGFHEDGVVSALQALQDFEKDLLNA